MPNRCCRNGHKASDGRCRAIWRSRARAPTMHRALSPRCRSRAWPRNAAREQTSGKPSRRRRSPCWCVRASGARKPMTESETEQDAGQDDAKRCGFVALIGAPNSGKSTLTNTLVGAKVSIVTQKAQTTRGPVRGLALIGNAQVILVDTPGIFQPKRRLDRAMFASAWDRAGDADLVAVVIDAQRGIDAMLGPLLKHLPEVRRPAIAVLNKIDLVAKPELLHLAADMSTLGQFDRVSVSYTHLTLP